MSSYLKSLEREIELRETQANSALKRAEVSLTDDNLAAARKQVDALKVLKATRTKLKERGGKLTMHT